MRKKLPTVTVGSGQWRGRSLSYPPNPAMRPTMQRTKHSLFSSLGPTLRDTVFVDCFAGAGGVGIEALSLGAGHVHFIESRREAIEALHENLALCGAARSRYDVHHARVADMLAHPPNRIRDAVILFADPPYDADPVAELLEPLRVELFDGLRLVIVEHRTKTQIEPPAGLSFDRTRRFGDTTLTYMLRA